MFIYCSECIYWFQNEYTEEFGQCRRKAPIPVHISSEGFIGAYNNRMVWPYVRINDGCGEGEKGKRPNISELTKDQTIKLDTKGKVNDFELAVQKARKEIK